MKNLALLALLVLAVACAPTAPATPVAPPEGERQWKTSPATEFLQNEVKSQRGGAWKVIVLNPEIDPVGVSSVIDSKPVEFEGIRNAKSVEFERQLNTTIKSIPPTLATSEKTGVEVYVSPKNRVVMVLLPGLTEFYTTSGLPTTDQVMVGFRGEIKGLISVAKISENETILYIETIE